MKNLSINERCLAVWRRAVDEPVTIHCEDKKMAESTRLRLYNALRGTINIAEKENLKKTCEILIDRKQHSITVQNRNILNREEKLSSALDVALGFSLGEQTPDSSLGTVDSSLELLTNKIEQGKRPSNPYFSRDED